MLHLYHNAYSTCSQKVRLTLFEKNLPFEATEMQFWKSDHLTPEYLEINPNGVVPSLLHDGEPILDSSVIVEYLDDVFPDVRLTPNGHLDRARMRSWMRYIEEVPTTAIRVPSFNKVFVKARSGLSDEELCVEADKRPLRKTFYQDLGREGFGDDRYDASLEQLRQTVERMDEALKKTSYLCADNLTLADVCVVPTIDRMQDLGLDSLWDDCPNLQRWWLSIQKRDSFKKTFFPGARVSEAYDF